MPRISVIVPVYNAEKELSHCLDSILAQTFPDFELILVDDGSRDASPQICDSYAAQDSRVRVLHQPNAGQAAARNAGLAMAQGEWAHFVDNDDRLHPQMLACLLSAAVESGASLSASGILEGHVPPADFEEPVKGDYVVHPVDEKWLTELYRSDDKLYWVCFAKLIRMDLIRELPFPTGDVFEDNAIICQWLHRSGRVAVCTDPLYFYYINPSGITKSAFNPRHLGWLAALLIQEDFYRKLDYAEMLSLICTRYVRDTAESCDRVRRELKDKQTAASLRAQCEASIRRNKDLLKLSPMEWRRVRMSLYPSYRAMMDLRHRLNPLT